MVAVNGDLKMAGNEDKLKCLMPNHGKKFNINLEKSNVQDVLKRIVTLQNDACIYLYMLGLSRNINVLNLPCKQCFLDAALQFEEIGSLMRELADDKSK